MKRARQRLGSLGAKREALSWVNELLEVEGLHSFHGAQILNLLKELRSSYDLSYLLIARNLATVRYMGLRVGVV